MALAPRTKTTATIRTGTMTVQVTRPRDTQGARSMWMGSRDGRSHFVADRGRSEPIEVDYTVTQDNGMLTRMVERAQGNRSGVSVRAMATCYADGRIRVNLTPNWLASLVRSAANNSNHRRMDGPLTVKVKLHREPEPYVALCANCKRPGAEHVLEQVERQGDHVESDQVDGRGKPIRVWDPNAIGYMPYWWCPTDASA